MAISRTQAASANADNVALSACTVGDLIVVFAYCNNAATIPTTATGFTSIGGGAANIQGYRLGYKIAVGGEVTTGNWTNATNVACLVFSGARAVGSGFNVNLGNTAALGYGPVTMQVGDGTSWIAGFGGAKAATAGMNGNTTRLTNRTNQTVINGLDTGAGVSTFTGTDTLNVTGSGRWVAVTLEIRQALTMTATVGSIAYTGVAVAVTKGNYATLATGSDAYTGVAMVAKKGSYAAPVTGSYALTGVSAAIKVGHLAGLTQGSFSVTGKSVAALVGRILSASSGSYAYQGVAVSALVGRMLHATAGAFALSGVDIILLRGSRLVASPGAFAFTGVSVAVLHGRRLIAGTGSFALSGSGMSALRGRRAPIGTAGFAVTGHDIIATVRLMFRLIAGTGSFAFTGHPLTTVLIIPQPPLPLNPDVVFTRPDPPFPKFVGKGPETAIPAPLIIPVRQSRPAITMGGRDYYSELSPYFISCSYTDNCDGHKADDFQMHLADRDRRFINDWMPDVGAFFDASIIAERWFSPIGSTLSLDCGRFWIDTVEFDLPSHTVVIKGSSIPTNIRIKGANETRGWEGTTLKDIAQQIAGENQMELDYQGDYNPKYKRVEQLEESGLSFLKARAEAAKLAIKVHRNTLVIFDEQKLEEADPKFTLIYGNSPATSGMPSYRLSSAKFHLKVNDTAKKVKVKHMSTETGDTSTDDFDSGESGIADFETQVNENPETDDGESSAGGDDALARLPMGADEPIARLPMRADEPISDWSTGADSGGARLAKSKARKKNKDKHHSHVELSIGNPLVAAGQTFILSGLGQFDGKWFVESAHHHLGPMYKTSLNVRRCLSGY